MPKTTQGVGSGRGRKTGTCNKKTAEFMQAYDALIASGYKDPLVVMFKLLNSRNIQIRFQAAKELLPYRYSKQASLRVEVDTPQQLGFSWDDVEVINDSHTDQEKLN